MRMGACVLLFVVGCGSGQGAGKVAAKPLPAGCFIEERPQPKLPEEKAVADYIIKESLRPKTVRFLKFGPHDTENRWARKVFGAKEPGTKAYRVVSEFKDFDGAAHRTDVLYIVQNGRVVAGYALMGKGDRWFGDLPADD